MITELIVSLMWLSESGVFHIAWFSYFLFNQYIFFVFTLRAQKVLVKRVYMKYFYKKN